MIINLAVAYILNRGEKNINTRAALLHVMADLLGSIAALTSGIVIYFTDWMVIDPILTLMICFLILFSTYHLLKEVLQIIMEAVPSHLDLDEVGLNMASIDNVSSVHDLHIWTLSSGKIALSAYIVLKDMSNWESVLAETKTILDKTFHIEHVTLQPELIEPKPIYHCDVKNEFESSETTL